MFNTKQVREIAKKAKVQCMKTYTDKMSIKDDKRRSVCFMFTSTDDAKTLYNTLMLARISNPVSFTSSYDHDRYRWTGYHYVRVMSHME